jgi:hypothetical protein
MRRPAACGDHDRHDRPNPLRDGDETGSLVTRQEANRRRIAASNRAASAGSAT